MKVRNIVFSGFAAAILMGTVDVNAAFTIASKDYVDNKVSELTGENGAITELSDLVAGENDALDDGFTSDTVVGAVNELKDDVDTLMGDADTAGSVAEAKAAADAAQADVDALETKVGTDTLTTTAQTVTGAINELDSALDGKVNVSDAATTIGAAASASDTKWATEKAVADALASVTGGAGSVSQQISDALGDLGTGNTTVEEALADKADATDVTALETKVGSDTLTTTAQTVTGAINELDAALDGKQDTLTTAQLAAVNSGIDATKVAAYEATQTAMSGSCTSESDYCVLVKNKDTGAMEWAGITLPFSMSVEP